jgi:hypothetical protein
LGSKINRPILEIYKSQTYAIVGIERETIIILFGKKGGCTVSFLEIYINGNQTCIYGFSPAFICSVEENSLLSYCTVLRMFPVGSHTSLNNPDWKVETNA